MQDQRIVQLPFPMQTRQAFFWKREKLSCNIKGRVEARLRENEGRGVISGELALNCVNKKVSHGNLYLSHGNLHCCSDKKKFPAKSAHLQKCSIIFPASNAGLQGGVGVSSDSWVGLG